MRTKSIFYVFFALVATGSWAAQTSQKERLYTLAGVYVNTAQDVLVTTAEGVSKKITPPQSRFIKVQSAIPTHDITRYLTQAIAHSSDFQPNPVISIKIGHKVYVVWIDQRGIMCHRTFVPGTMSRDQAITWVLSKAGDTAASCQIYLAVSDDDVHAIAPQKSTRSA
jgi:hypothetical protein